MTSNLQTPDISVVMSVLNGQDFVADAIESILQQTFTNFEFILIDDGSTDETWRVISTFADRDPRIVPVKQENIGLTRSLNKGVGLARAPYIARQDADDTSHPDRFSTQLPYLASLNFDLCCARATIIETGKVTPRLAYFLPKRWLMRFMNPFIHGTFMIKKSSLDKVGGYDESFIFAQDYHLIRRMMAANLRIKYLPDSLYRLKISTSAKHKDIQNRYAEKVRSMRNVKKPT